ncbi:MAG: amidohydrolase family protein [Planctomycetota bacterium]
MTVRPTASSFPRRSLSPRLALTSLVLAGLCGQIQAQGPGPDARFDLLEGIPDRSYPELAPPPVRTPVESPLLVVRAGRLLPIDGPPIERGMLICEDGVITAVGKELDVPEGARVLDYPDSVIVPGFVELHCHVGVTGGDINDMVIGHNMDLRTLDLVTQDSPELAQAVRAGVTSALIIPGSGSTIGGLGTFVKTWGPTFEQRLLRYPGALKIALHARGGNPSRRSGDLGSMRLGLHYMLKVTMQDARRYHDEFVAFESGDGEKPAFNPRLDPLRGLWRQEFPVLLHAYGQNDTMTSIRILLWGLRAPIVISHGVYDSFKIADVLAQTGVPMNIGPRQFEFDEGVFVGNAAELDRAGVPTSICTDAPVVDQDQLFVQAAMAVRLGMPWEHAMIGLTLEPARAIGFADRLGSLTVGKDADFAVYPGDPLDPRNAPQLVVVDGMIAVDRRRDPRDG